MAKTQIEWFPDNLANFEQSLALNTHLGADTTMPPSRVTDREGLIVIVLSFKLAARVIATIIKQKFKVICYKEENIN